MKTVRGGWGGCGWGAVVVGLLITGGPIVAQAAVQATGGTVITSDGITIHTFASGRTFTVTTGGEVEYLILGGGGGGGYSLVLVAPWTLPNHALPESWRLSTAVDGGPGQYDGQRFADWKTTHGITGDLDDGDNDGLSALLEFTLFGNPAAASQTSLPYPSLTTIGPDQFLTLTVRVNRGADDVLIFPERSMDLKQLKFDLADRRAFATWVRVHDKLAAGEMPPPDEDQPSPEERLGAHVPELADHCRRGWLQTRRACALRPPEESSALEPLRADAASNGHRG